MKIFDFTDGKKGREIGNIKIANSMGGWLIREGDEVFKIEIAHAPGGGDWEWQAGATYIVYEGGEPVRDEPITPEKFGVEAICFSTGKWKTGIGDPRWQWHVVSSEAWRKAAIERGVLKSTFVRKVQPEEDIT